MKKWYLLGVGIGAAILSTLLFLDWNYTAAMAITLLFVAIAIGLATNFGMRYTHEAGWSHVQQRPWVVEEEPSPVGAVATGYIVVMTLSAICFILWMYVKYGK